MWPKCSCQGAWICGWRLASTGKCWLQKGNACEQYTESIPTPWVLFVISSGECEVSEGEFPYGDL